MSFSETAPEPGNDRSVSVTTESVLTLATTIDPGIAHAFLVTARCGCFMQAARSLNLKSHILRKHLAQLEGQLRFPLFRYQGNALTLSREGQSLQAQLISMSHERILPVAQQPLVRLAVAESILHDILQRELITLLRRNARIRLEIIVLDSVQAMQSVSADVALWLSEPDSAMAAPCFVTTPPVRLACLEYLPHIAKRYSRVAARPDSLEDLTDYMLAQRPQERDLQSLRPWHAFVEQRLFGVVRVPAYDLMLETIRCSACIGLFPAYMTRFDRGLVALPGLFSDSMRLEVWMATSAHAAHSEPVQLIADLILTAFRDRGDWF
ncbi:LysR family transcriptional regulator [Pseudomonas sp. NPDC089734]|uniref:LysR family transcriptional regulator n=1 Tax=Pseudomonas sp. NPDC089734 TaxID=3364469 RepID=UPI0037F60F3F